MELTHVDAHGNAHMVEVEDKPITQRLATARGSIQLGEDARNAIAQRRNKKGCVLTIAQIAGIQGAKKTSDLIPLCHPLPLTGVDVELSLTPTGVDVRATARATWRTGVEMEALTAVSTTLLTIYDMVKAVERSARIECIELVEKRGGRSGSWSR